MLKSYFQCYGFWVIAFINFFWVYLSENAFEVIYFATNLMVMKKTDMRWAKKLILSLGHWKSSQSIWKYFCIIRKKQIFDQNMNVLSILESLLESPNGHSLPVILWMESPDGTAIFYFNTFKSTIATLVSGDRQ